MKKQMLMIPGLALSLLYLNSVTVFAQSKAVNLLCNEAGLKSLRLVGEKEVDRYRARDLCSYTAQDLKPAETKLLQQVSALHASVGELFGIKANELVGIPFDLFIQKSASGFTQTYAFNDITMRIFPELPFSLNPGIYLHELGHMMARHPGPAVPQGLFDLNNSTVSQEALADWIAVAIEGVVFSPGSSLQCLDRLRYITQGQTYFLRKEYFSVQLTAARIYKCCQSLVKYSTYKPEVNFCRNNVLAESSEIAKKRNIHFTKAFDPLEEGAADVDPHQIGVPVVSFIKELSVNTGLAVASLFKLAFSPRNFKFTHPKSFRCEIRKGKEVLEVKQTTLFNIETVLNNVRAQLNAKQAKIFDKAFTKHGLSVGYQYDLANNIRYAEQKATGALTRDTEKKAKHSCAGIVAEPGADAAGKCYAVCEP